LHTRVAAASVQERIGVAFVASLDSVKRTRPPDDDNDGAASVSGDVAPPLPVACNGHQSSGKPCRFEGWRRVYLGYRLCIVGVGVSDVTVTVTWRVFV